MRLVLVVLIGVLLVGVPFQATAEQKDQTYRFHEGPDEKPAGWATNHDVGAKVDPYGRNGRRCLAISSYWKNAVDPEWRSPEMPVDGALLDVTCWLAFSFLYSPDANYGPKVAAVELDQNRNELRRADVIINQEGNIPYSFLISARNRNWRYCKAQYAPGPGAKYVRWVFSIHNRNVGANGEAWMEDLCISPARKKSTEGKKPKDDIRLNVNTEFALNLFWPDDPLLFDVSIYRRTHNDMTPIGLDGAKLRCVVRDYDDLVLLRGEETAEGAVDVKVDVKPDGYLSSWNRKNYVKTVRLPDRLKDENIGRYMKIKFTLVKDGREIASDEKGFGIITPRELTAELAEKSKFGGSPGPEMLMTDFKRPPVHQQLGLTWIRIYAPGWHDHNAPSDPIPVPQWDRYGWPRPGSKYLALHPHAMIHACSNLDAPEWALLPGKEDIPNRIDPDKFQIWLRHVVAETAVRYGDRVRLWLVGNEGILGTKDYATLFKKSSRTIKEAAPGMQVAPGAFLVAGLPVDSKPLADFLDTGVLDYCNWLDEHTGRTPEEYEAYYGQMRKELAKRGTDKKLIATEFDTDGAWPGMEKYCKDMLQRHAAAFYAGLDVADWFMFYHMDVDEDGRQFSPLNFDQQIYMGDHRPQVCLRNSFTNASNFYARPATFTLYNLTRSLDYCTPKAKIDLGADTTCYLFDVLDHCTAVVWRESGAGPKTVGLSFDDRSVKLIEMTGRLFELHPLDGAVTFTITERPQILVFPGKPSYLKLSDAFVRVMDKPIAVAKGGSAKLEVSTAGVEGVLNAGIGLDWKIQPEQIKVDLKAGKSGSHEIVVTAPGTLQAKSYPLTIRLESGGRLVSAITQTVQVREPVDFEIDTSPLTSASKPAIVVKVTNSSNESVKCDLQVLNPVTAEPRPVMISSKLTLKPGDVSTMRFPVEEKYVSLDQKYLVEAVVKSESLSEVRKTTEVGFVGAAKAKRVPVIDGDLSEWDRSYPLTLGLMEKWQGDSRWADPALQKSFAWDGDQGAFPWKGPKDLSGQFYLAWDDRKLYMAVEVTDDAYVNDNVDALCWNGDAIEVGMNPGREVTGTRFSDEAIARTKLGNQVFRGLTPEGGGPSSLLVDDMDIAVQVENGKLTYEIAWPREAWKPLKFKPGTVLRLNVLAMEEDRPGGPNNRWQNRWICWFPGLSADKNPRQFGLVTLSQE